MMAVTGAASDLTRLPSIKTGLSFSLAALDLTNTMRAGQQFIEVGPMRKVSYRRCSSSSATGLSCHALWVCASRNSWPKAVWINGVPDMMNSCQELDKKCKDTFQNRARATRD